MPEVWTLIKLFLHTQPGRFEQHTVESCYAALVNELVFVESANLQCSGFLCVFNIRFVDLNVRAQMSFCYVDAVRPCNEMHTVE